MTKEQIKHLVDRFLSWTLPESFNPDNGISYVRPRHRRPDTMPSGTNLLDAVQAEEMVRHMVDGMPAPQEETGWLIERTNGTQPVWWGPPCSRWDWQHALVTPDLWTTNASKAVRFARKEDAEAMIRFEGWQHAIATDHMWL